MDDARERLEALVNRQSHGRSRHLTNDLSGKGRRQRSDEQTDQRTATGGQRNTPHHAVDHQSLDDGAETPHQFLDLGGARWRVRNISDYQEAVPGDGSRELLHDKQKPPSVNFPSTGSAHKTESDFHSWAFSLVLAMGRCTFSSE